MSDGGKNVGRSRVDARESQRTDSRGSPSSDKKQYSEDEYFDSGIQSECLSSGVISETDIKYDSALDCGYDSRSFDKEDVDLKDLARKLPKEVDYKSQVSQVSCDSGLLVDYDPIESSAEDVVTKSRPLDPLKYEPKPLDPLNSWDVFFEPDDEGNTQLHLAIIQGREDRALLILSRIPESRYLDLKNHRRETCLHLSVLVEMPYITRKLLLAGAKTGIEDSNGNTPLHLACKLNNLECVEALLNKSSISRDMTYTVFMYNPKIDYPHKYIDEWNYDGLTCTHLAAVHRDLGILYQLFVNDCDVNKRECKGGYTILHAAVRSGRIDLVKFILQHKKLNKVNTEIQNYARLTAYQLSPYPQIAKILAENGAVQLSPADDSDEDSSDESSDDESLENSGLGSTSHMMNSLINSVIPTVVTTAS